MQVRKDKQWDRIKIKTQEISIKAVHPKLIVE